MDEDRDPFNEPETAHPRARALMREEFLWDCTDEEAPFGSDEGHDAYFEFREWRSRNPAANLTECLSWIMGGSVDGYSASLAQSDIIERDLANPEKAFLAEHYDMFTLDATVIATALGQLIDEGKIDAEAKPCVFVAIDRQMNPQVVSSPKRHTILMAVRRAVDAA